MQQRAISSTSEDLGKLVLRVTLAVLMLFHGISKIFNGIAPITGTIAQAGLPAWIGYLVFVGEVIAPLLMLFGIWTRIAGVVVATNMIVAVSLVHTHQIFTLAKTGGWALELQGLLLAAAVTVALIGAGRFSVGGRSGRWN